MRVFVLNPPFVKDFCRSARWAAVSRGRVQRHPDWLLLLAGMLEKHEHTVDFIDGPVAGLQQQEIISRVSEFHPQMVVCHTTTPSIYNDLDYCRRIRQTLPESIIVLVGSHAGALPRETLELSKSSYEDCINAVAVGECEWSIAELAQSPERLSSICGLASMQNGQFSHKDRPPGNVNELAFPAWKFINPDDYHDAGKRFPFLTLIHARGCIGNCIFCRDKDNTGIRSRDVDLVVKEMEYDKTLFPEIQEIMFETDNFASDPEYAQELCQAIIKSGINKKLTWSCNTRVDIPLQLLPIMKEAGCRMLMVGFEFGTQEALDSVKKGVTLEQAREFAHRANELGFTLHGCFMIGAPGENEESAQKTIDFAKSLPCDTVQFSGLCPYPGTPLYEWARSNDFLIPKDWKEWVSKDYEQCTLLSYKQFPKEKMDFYIDKGLKEFYLRPSQIWKMILSIKSFSDVRRKLFGFKSFFAYFKKKK